MMDRPKDQRPSDRGPRQPRSTSGPDGPFDDKGAVIRREEHKMGNEPHRQIGGSQTQRDERVPPEEERPLQRKSPTSGRRPA